MKCLLRTDPNQVEGDSINGQRYIYFRNNQINRQNKRFFNCMALFDF